MRNNVPGRVWLRRAAVIAGLMLSHAAFAEQIEVGNYGVSAGSMPWAIAFEKGYFKEEGADITGVVASNGGGTAMRNTPRQIRHSAHTTKAPTAM